MKKLDKLPGRLMTACFLLVLFLFGGLTLGLNARTIAGTAKSAYDMAAGEGMGTFDALKKSISSIETEYNMVFFSKATFMAGNALVRTVLGSRFFPPSDDDLNMIRLSDGSIGKVKFSMDPEINRRPLTEFKEYLDGMGVPLVFVYVHTKVLEPESQIPFGAFDFSNRHADAFLAMLADIGIDYVDTRDVLLNSDLPADELYFRTDTHWTIPAAFRAYRTLAEHLNQNYGFQIADQFTDPNNYETRVYEDLFMGSFGTQTTPYYAGTEDFAALYPRFDTHVTERTQRNDNNWQVREGSFEEAVMALDQLEPDEGKSYSSRCYQSYNYNWGEVLYENGDPAADDKRVLIIKNSSGNPITDFMALSVSNVCGLDRRNLLRTTIAEYVADYQPDVVVIVYNYDFLRPDRMDFFTTPASSENQE